jgi:hypothetical protein
VHLVQVDPAHAQPAGAGHGALLHDQRQRQERKQLRRQEGRRLRPLAERLPQDPLAAPEAVHLGGVEQRHAEV